jgi:hypothetical protein
VIRRLYPCLLAVPLLVSCDKPRDAGGTGETTGKPKPQVTRTTRPPRGDSPDAPENLRASLKSACEIESPEEREQAVAEVAWSALELDPELAREAFQQLTPDSVEKIRLVQHFAMRLAEENPDEALKWADALGSEKEIAAARCQIALVISNDDPQRAANLLSESGIEGRAFDVVAVQVLQRWAAKTPPDAAAWVVMFPPGKSREAGIKSVVSQWAEQDARAAFSWMGKLEDRALREESAQAVAEILAERPEDVRNAWLQHADPETRGAIGRKTKEAGLDDPPP